MRLVGGSPEDDLTAALHALLAESLVLWCTPHRLRPFEPSSAIVLCDEAGAPFLTVELHRPPSDLGRWLVTSADRRLGTPCRVCSSILGVLETVSTAVGFPLENAAAIRLGAPSSAP